MKNFYLLLILQIVYFDCFSQLVDTTRLSMAINIRPRAEFRNGAFTLKSATDDPAFFISQRSRLSLNYQIRNLSIGLAAQDIRVWGKAPLVTPSDGNSTMINEAWIEYEFLHEFSFKAGRQSLIYDDDRILGSLDWNQAGRWHDALLFKIEPRNIKIHAAFAYNQDNENRFYNFYSAPGGNYKTLMMLWYGNKISNEFSFSLLGLNTGFQAPDSSLYSIQTFGGNIYHLNSPINFTGTFYYQRGTNASGIESKAFLAAIYGALRISDNINLLAGTDYLSGNDLNDPTPNKTSAFQPLYGTNHKFYGYMDYFYAGSGHNNVGLWDKYLGLGLKFSTDFSIQAMAHHFNSAGDLTGENDPTSYLGTEIDLTFIARVTPYMQWSGGYSQMFATESMEIVKGGGNSNLLQNWVWIMLNVNPVILREIIVF